MKNIIFFLFFIVTQTTLAQEIALVKYAGGGDWYANPTSLSNLAGYCNQTINTKLNTNIATVEVGSAELFTYPFIHMTGHGNVVFSPNDVQNLKKYLSSGGFLHIDDNYGMDKYVRKEIAKIFPDKELKEISAQHPIFKEPNMFENGLPKIHEHENKRPQAFGIFIENKLVLLYTFECDLGDGWEDKEVHNDPDSIRESALKMGANIINYAFKN